MAVLRLPSAFDTARYHRLPRYVPDGIEDSANAPLLVLKSPSVLLYMANAPVAVFSSGMVLFKSETVPAAVLLMPVVLSKSAAVPNAVLASALLKSTSTRAGGGVEASRGVAKERRPTNCCVRSAGGEAKKRLRSFCGSEVGIASVWRRDHCLRSWQKPKTRQSRFSIELSFVVSCSFFRLRVLPRRPWYPGEFCSAFRDFSSLRTHFRAAYCN